MATEVERRFLVDDPAVVEEHAERSAVVRQGYVAIDPDGAQVRVRHIGDASVLTVKRGWGECRFETELDIADETFDSLWPLTEGRRVVKRRFFGEISDDLGFEADVFEDSLAGLAIVEVEFGSVEEANDFEAPGWFGREVTDDDRYSNVRLAVEGNPEASA